MREIGQQALQLTFVYKGKTKKKLPHVLTITIKEIAKGQATAARTNHQASCVNFN